MLSKLNDKVLNRLMASVLGTHAADIEARVEARVRDQFTAEVAALRHECSQARAECLRATSAFSKEVMQGVRAELAKHAAVLKQSADAATEISRLLHRK